jgi:hypothetical protein
VESLYAKIRGRVRPPCSLTKLIPPRRLISEWRALSSVINIITEITASATPFLHSVRTFGWQHSQDRVIIPNNGFALSTVKKPDNAFS